MDLKELQEINAYIEECEKVLKELKQLEAVEKVNRREGETMDQCVSRGIATLINEGYEQEQAAAIAYSMCGEKSKDCCEECKKPKQ